MRRSICKQDVHDAYNKKIDEGNLKMAWGAANVPTWYKNDKGRVTQNWPFTLVEFWNQTREMNPADYTFIDAADGVVLSAAGSSSAMLDAPRALRSARHRRPAHLGEVDQHHRPVQVVIGHVERDRVGLHQHLPVREIAAQREPAFTFRCAAAP